MGSSSIRNWRHCGMQRFEAWPSMETASMKPQAHSSGSSALTQCMRSSGEPRTLSTDACTAEIRGSEAYDSASGGGTGCINSQRSSARAPRWRASRLWSSVEPLRSRPVMWSTGGIATPVISGCRRRTSTTRRRRVTSRTASDRKNRRPKSLRIGWPRSSAQAAKGPRNQSSPKSSRPAAVAASSRIESRAARTTRAIFADFPRLPPCSTNRPEEDSPSRVSTLFRVSSGPGPIYGGWCPDRPSATSWASGSPRSGRARPPARCRPAPGCRRPPA